MLLNAAEDETERRALRELTVKEFCEHIAHQYAQTVARTPLKNLREKLHTDG